MERQFFVMLNTQDNNFIAPLVSGYHNEVALFDSEDQAREAADNNLLGASFGYEIFERGMGS